MKWSEWHRWFNDLFGCGSWVDASVETWIRDVFVPGGMTPDEMKAAALAVARDGPPGKPHEILNALLTAARSARAAELMARDAQDREGGADVSVPGCTLCEGTGWVTVPQRPQPADAEAKGYLQTCAVTCRCVAGLRLSGVVRDHRDQASMTLEQYEARFGRGWPDEVRWWRKKQAADGQIKAATKGWDEAAERILKNIERRKR